MVPTKAESLPAKASRMQITQATDPVTTGGSTRSTAGLPAHLMTKPMMMLRMPVATMPVCSTAITLLGGHAELHLVAHRLCDAEVRGDVAEARAVEERDEGADGALGEDQ